MKKIIQLTTAVLALSLSGLTFATESNQLLIINGSNSDGDAMNISYKICDASDETPTCTAAKTYTIADSKNLEIKLQADQVVLLLTAELQDQNHNIIASSNYTYTDPNLPSFTDSHCAGTANSALILGNHGSNRLICLQGAA